MYMKPNNYGLIVEKEIIDALDGKRYMSLSPNMKALVRDLFGAVNPIEKIRCEKCDELIKPDIKVSVKDVVRYVSIKSGSSNVFHSEHISTVIPFLRECGVDEQSLKTLTYYHFGDGTLNGTGKVRMDYHDTYRWLRKEIAIFNDAVNSDFEIVKKIIDRILFQGVREDAAKVDFIYVGDLDFGSAVSRNQIIKHLQRKGYNFYENIHVGQLLIRPHAKYAHGEIQNEYSRHRMDFYWPKLKEDIEYIHKRYSNDYIN